MKILHLRAKDFKTSVWSGGTTTQLYLHPETGSYADRNFQFRISSATVDLEESEFTLLPGVVRFITPLDGSFVLTHPGVPPVKMAALAAPYRFSGEVPTHCVGKATDLNLMLNGCRGNMELRQNSASIAPGFNGFYPTQDTVFVLENKKLPLKKGELLTIFSEEYGSIRFSGAQALVCWAEL